MAKISIPTKTTPDGRQFLDIPELRELSRASDDFFKDMTTKGDVSLRNDLYAKLTTFFDYVIHYSENVFTGKTYDFDHVVPHLFIWPTDIKSMKSSKYDSLDMFLLVVFLGALVHDTFSGYWIASSKFFMMSMQKENNENTANI